MVQIRDKTIINLLTITTMKNTENKIEVTEALNQNELASIDGGGLYDSTIKLIQQQLDNVSRWYNS
jgi:hypothetical protein